MYFAQKEATLIDVENSFLTCKKYDKAKAVNMAFFYFDLSN